MKLKAGVSLKGVRWEMFQASIIVEYVMENFGAPCEITSGVEGKHKRLTLHKEGKALDYRTKYPQLNGRELELRDAVATALGVDYDVIMEHIGEPEEHLHVEYDPDILAVDPGGEVKVVDPHEEI